MASREKSGRFTWSKKREREQGQRELFLSLEEAYKCRHHWAVVGSPWEEDGSPLGRRGEWSIAANGRMSTDEGRMTATERWQPLRRGWRPVRGGWQPLSGAYGGGGEDVGCWGEDDSRLAITAAERRRAASKERMTASKGRMTAYDRRMTASFKSGLRRLTSRAGRRGASSTTWRGRPWVGPPLLSPAACEGWCL